MNPKKILPCAISAIALCWPQLSNAQEAATLPTVKVEGQVQAEPSPSAPVDGYKANSTFSATKTGTPVVETQQSISVITRDRIEDQGALTLQDALGYTAGVSALALMALTIAATGLLSAVLRLCSTKMV